MRATAPWGLGGWEKGGPRPLPAGPLLPLLVPFLGGPAVPAGSTCTCEVKAHPHRPEALPDDDDGRDGCSAPLERDKQGSPGGSAV